MVVLKSYRGEEFNGQQDQIKHKEDLGIFGGVFGILDALLTMELSERFPLWPTEAL
jgi:hypothetical protein